MSDLPKFKEILEEAGVFGNIRPVSQDGVPDMMSRNLGRKIETTGTILPKEWQVWLGMIKHNFNPTNFNPADVNVVVQAAMKRNALSQEQYAELIDVLKDKGPKAQAIVQQMNKSIGNQRSF